MSIGPFQILIIALILLLLFGRGRISEFMGDFGKGVKSFRKGLSDDDETPALGAPLIDIAPAVEPQPSAEPTGK